MKKPSENDASQKQEPALESRMSDDGFGNRMWRTKENNLHRLDGPAMELVDGSKQWWKNGKRHRLDGPAVDLSGGNTEWWVEGRRHRVDGPAIDYNGYKEWYIDGKALTEKEFNAHPAKLDFDMAAKKGRHEWRNEKGQLHRTNGPAIEWPDGSKVWMIDGERHRTDGPAVDLSNGQKTWWFKGRIHRLDGPAVEWADGEKEWWIGGERLDKKAFDAHPEKLAFDHAAKMEKEARLRAAHQNRLNRLNGMKGNSTRRRRPSGP